MIDMEEAEETNFEPEVEAMGFDLDPLEILIRFEDDGLLLDVYL